MKINGTVAPGFESVRALFERNMERYAERNVQLCVYHGEDCVVDLWASAIDDPMFDADSLVNVFSSGKSLEAVLLAKLVDLGLLDFNAKIADYWPEFAANGKGVLTLANLMRHEAGLAAFDTTIDPVSLHTAQIKSNRLGTIIEQQTPRFGDGGENQREYHAITRGWIANEIFRRVEPAGRTMGEYLREEIGQPLDIDVYINVPNDALARISPVKLLGAGYQLLQSLIPRSMGRRIVPGISQLLRLVLGLLPAARNNPSLRAPDAITGIRNLEIFNSPMLAAAEVPSAGAKCSARGLAKLAAVMANGGRLGDHILLSEAAWQALHADPVSRRMMVSEIAFTQGGLAAFGTQQSTLDGYERAMHQGREGFYGWMGLGGSIFQWHPQRKIGFAFVPTSLHTVDVVNERGKIYQSEILNCLTRLSN